jgi:hypothetical protein
MQPKFTYPIIIHLSQKRSLVEDGFSCKNKESKRQKTNDETDESSNVS